MVKQVDLSKSPIFVVTLSWRIVEIPDATIGKDYNRYALVKGVFKKLFFALWACFPQILDLYENSCLTWHMAEGVVHLSCTITDWELRCDHLRIELRPTKVKQDESYCSLADLRFTLVKSVPNSPRNLPDC